MSSEDVLRLLIEMTKEGSQRSALEHVLADVTTNTARLNRVASRARLLALGVQDNTKYVMNTHWIDDILLLTIGLPDEEPYSPFDNWTS